MCSKVGRPSGRIPRILPRSCDSVSYLVACLKINEDSNALGFI